MCVFACVGADRDRVSAYEVGEMVCMEVNGTEASTHSTAWSVGVQDDMYDVMPWGSDGPSG